jgi:hypothetical protein
MRIRLNGWRRIGVVLSVIWFVSFYWYLWDREKQKAQKEFQTVEAQCEQYLSEEEKLKERFDFTCFFKGYKAYEAKIEKVSTPLLVAIDFGSVVLWWIVLRLLLSVYRWIVRGFTLDKMG